MERKQRLFIYDRKEMGVLLLIGVMVAFFAFTFGVHLGKRVSGKVTLSSGKEAAPVQTLQDEVPSRPEIQDYAKGVPQAADESLSQALHDEVSRTGIKLDRPRQTVLPEKRPLVASAPAAHAVANTTATKAQERAPVDIESVAAFKRVAPTGRFTLQIGSHETLQNAKDQIDAMEALGLKPLLRAAEIKGKGRWFRVFLGGFPSKDDADQAGERFRAQHVIDSFVVSKIAE